MLNERQRAEALGIGLAALGLLVGVATLYPELAGGAGNPVGPAGAAVHAWASAAFGVVAFLVVLPAFVWGVRCFELIGRDTAIRLSILVSGLLVLVPAAIRVIGGPGEGAMEAAGWVGRAVGEALEGGFGVLGASVIAVALGLALSVLTLGWSPGRGLTGFSRAVRAGLRAAGVCLRTAGRGARWSVRAGRALFAGNETGPSSWEGPARTPPSPVDAEPARRRSPKPRSTPEAREQVALLDSADLSETERPPVQLLTEPVRRSSGLSERELRGLGDVLVRKLATFRIEGEIGGWTTGPVVTQFEVVPAAGVKVGQIAARADDLALALRAPSVRIVAPIPGKGAVGVEVPNPEPEMVYLREILESDSYLRTRSDLPLALGRDLSGTPYCADLARMPHLLIAGATGSGKSICVNAIITSLIYRYSPTELRLLMIDPKMVELSVYNDLPHLRHPVVTDNEEAASILKWAVFEMKRRFGLLSANGCRNVEEFNRRVRAGQEILLRRRRPEGEAAATRERPHEEGELPTIVLVIDELADLMATVQAEVETPLAMLAQKARAVGLHLVVATQRPSVNVITGLIKANFPSRIAFRVASKTDSRTILDQNGAESLLGNGDMLFLPPGESDPVRIQGAYVSSQDTERILRWYRERATARAAQAESAGRERDILEVVRELEDQESRPGVAGEVLAERDELFGQAAEIVVANSSGSTSLLQRRLKIGYGRAARIIDQLHHAGVVGPAEGSRPREILVGLEDLEEILRNG
ncbi:MAG: DNA translocase FtsK 4TM domain-containing protein [Gemmatimonadota bacterium]